MGERDTLIGQNVSHYRVVERLGGGGMGVVYKAEGTKLGRFVALKFIPGDLARDPRAIERFEHEAQAASAPDHPNICTIHGIGEHEGRPFLATQCMEGQTLRHRIGGRPMPLEALLELAVEVAEEQLTSPGTALGRVAYMSPEQVRGEQVDARQGKFRRGSTEILESLRD